MTNANDLIRRGDALDIYADWSLGPEEIIAKLRAIPVAAVTHDLPEAHDEQLGIWADELMADLAMGGMMDLVDHEYDTKVDARKAIIAALKGAGDCREAYILKSASDAKIEAAVMAERERAKVMVWTLGHEIRAAMLVDEDKEDAVMEMVKATAAAIRARGEAAP